MDASDSCILQYRRNIRNFGRFLKHEATAADLDDDLLCGFISSYAKDRSPSTANKVRAQLVSLWTFLAKRKIADTYPDVPKLKEYKRVPLAWLQGQLDKLWAQCEKERGEFAGVPAGDWWIALHNVFWDIGSRLGATLAICWDDVDLEDRHVIVRAEGQKQRADQLFPLHPDTVVALLKIKTVDRAEIFPYDCCYGTIFNRYKRLLERAGLPTDRRSKFHRMRRSVASHFRAAGGDATALLGHASESTTRAHYYDTRVTGGITPPQVLFRPSGQMAVAGT